MERSNINTLKRTPDAIGPNDEKLYVFVGPMKEGSLSLEQIVEDFPEFYYTINIKDLNTLTEEEIQAFDFENSNVHAFEVISFDQRPNPIDFSSWNISLLDEEDNILGTSQSTSTGIVFLNILETFPYYTLLIQKRK